MRNLTVWSFLSLLVGCAPSVEVSEVVSGIYTLKATTRADSCTPLRFSGELDTTVGVFAAPETLSLVDAGLSWALRYDLRAEEGYSERTPRSGDRILPCPESNDGSVVKTHTLIAASKDRIEVDAVQDWDIPLSCPDRGVDPLATPKASCHSQRTLVYELRTECRPPCAAKTGTDLKDLFCDCSSLTN